MYLQKTGGTELRANDSEAFRQGLDLKHFSKARATGCTSSVSVKPFRASHLEERVP
jgi:hypothetical protein